jgi:hypothetical protein
MENRKNIFEAMGARNSSPERIKKKEEETKGLDTFLDFARDIGVMAKYQDIQTMFDKLDKQQGDMTAQRLEMIDTTVSDTIPYAISDTFQDTEYQSLNHFGYGRNKPTKERGYIPKSKIDFECRCRRMYRDFTEGWVTRYNEDGKAVSTFHQKRYTENEQGEPVFDEHFIQEFTQLVERTHEYYANRLPSIENLRHAEVATSQFFEGNTDARELFSHADQVRIVDLEALYDDGEDDLLVALAVRHGVKLKDVRAYMVELDGMDDEKHFKFGADSSKNNSLSNLKKELAFLIYFVDVIHKQGNTIPRYVVADQSIRTVIENKEAFELILEGCILPIKDFLKNSTKPGAGYTDTNYRGRNFAEEAVNSFLTHYHDLVRSIDKELKRRGERKKS